MQDLGWYWRSGVWLTWLDWFWPYINVLICQSTSCTCHIWLGKLSCTWTSLKLQFLIWILWSHFISLFLVLNPTITYEQEVKLSLGISPCHDHELIVSTAYTEYSIHQVLHSPMIYSLQLPGGFLSLISIHSSLISQCTLLYGNLFLPTNVSFLINIVLSVRVSTLTVIMVLVIVKWICMMVFLAV